MSPMLLVRGLSYGYQNVIVYENLTLKHKAGVLNSSRFEERFRKAFRSVLMWTVGLTIETKLRFQISPSEGERGPKRTSLLFMLQSLITFQGPRIFLY